MSAARRFQCLAGAALLITPGPPAILGVLPARADDSAACATLTDKVRLACLEAAAIPKAKEGVQAPVGLGAKAASPLSRDSYRTVTVADLVERPETSLRQPIALGGARCFYLGVGDYRCIVQGASTVAILGQVVFPPGAQVAVERGCEEGDVGSPPKCEYKLLFVPTSFRKADTSGGKTASVFDTPSIMFASEAPLALPVKKTP